MLLNVCLLVLRLLFFEKFAGALIDKSMNMVWGPHIARVKTKNICITFTTHRKYL